MLRVFRIVAEQGTLAGAAEILGRTPSAVSMMLQQLEDHLGAALFETDRKNRLSALGRLVLAESTHATDAFDRSTSAIGRHLMSAAGTVRIAAVPSATVSLLPAAVATFRRSRPDVRLEISDIDSASVRRLVRFGEADIGILSAAPGDAGEGETILCDDLGIVHRKDGPIWHALRERSRALSWESLSWELLALEPLIVNPLCHLVDNAEVGKLVEGCNLQARNTTALLSFVRGGLGATILPHSALASGPEGLAFIRPANPLAQRELRKIHSTERRLSPVALAFWNILTPH
ncbi:LysR family transcriptional regulator [Salaquimonas pukyongi]|uniref:LysR family transcriptional regulator n=1 Tax=Salaquimonas pukyongi TaxID=2712698 RepID=UPI0009FACDB2|nr:LysR family transcriptional regulator [Salaquimonas pukyongi]